MDLRRSILVCAALLACADDAAVDAGTDGSTSMSTASSDPSTTDPSTTATASSTDTTTTDPSTTASTSTDPTESSSDPDGSSSQTSADPDSSSGDTSSSDAEASSSTGDADADYRAIALIGGLNRVRIFKRNDAEDLCTFISLVDPSFGELGSIDVTQPWGVEFAGISDSAAACDSDTPQMFGSDGATDGSGAVDLADVGMGGVPCTVDIDITLVFDDAVLQVPGIDTMTADDVPVQGC